MVPETCILCSCCSYCYSQCECMVDLTEPEAFFSILQKEIPENFNVIKDYLNNKMEEEENEGEVGEEIDESLSSSSSDSSENCD